MKKNTLQVGLLISLLIFPLVLFGQNKTITKEEYDSIREAAQKKTDQKIRRETTTEIRYLNKSEPTKVTIVQEFLPPDKSKWSVIETNGKSIKKIELVYLGDLEYRKIDDNDWKMRNLKSGDSGGGMGFTAKEDKRTEKYSIDEMKINGGTYRVLTVTTINPEKTIFSENKIWIDKEGLFYKKESKSSLGSKDNLMVPSVTTYDYKIKDVKIEAPIK